MKKLFLILLFGMGFVGNVFAAGTVVQTAAMIDQGHMRTITFTCTGDSSDGSIPDTDLSADNAAFVKGYYFYKVEAFPTAGGTAPDAADVLIYDASGLELLGSEDGGTTAYDGLNLIHATLTRACMPNIYLPRAGLHLSYFPEVTGVLTLDVDNQATNSAEYTIVLTFVK